MSGQLSNKASEVIDAYSSGDLDSVSLSTLNAARMRLSPCGTVLYSYGEHHPLTVRSRDRRGNHILYLNTSYASVTTAKHVRGASYIGDCIEVDEYASMKAIAVEAKQVYRRDCVEHTLKAAATHFKDRIREAQRAFKEELKNLSNLRKGAYKSLYTAAEYLSKVLEDSAAVTPRKLTAQDNLAYWVAYAFSDGFNKVADKLLRSGDLSSVPYMRSVSATHLPDDGIKAFEGTPEKFTSSVSCSVASRRLLHSAVTRNAEDVRKLYEDSLVAAKLVSARVSKAVHNPPEYAQNLLSASDIRDVLEAVSEYEDRTRTYLQLSPTKFLDIFRDSIINFIAMATGVLPVEWWTYYCEDPDEEIISDSYTIGGVDTAVSETLSALIFRNGQLHLNVHTIYRFRKTLKARRNLERG